MTTLPQTLFDEIERHGRDAYPEECVGALIGNVAAAGSARTVERLFAIDNRSGENRKRRYLVSPLDYLAAERAADSAGKTLLGFYHSHPEHPAEPSTTDLAWGAAQLRLHHHVDPARRRRRPRGRRRRRIPARPRPLRLPHRPTGHRTGEPLHSLSTLMIAPKSPVKLTYADYTDTPEDGRFAAFATYGREDSLNSPTLPGLTLDLADVFG